MENSFTLDRQTLRDMRDVLDAIRREHGGSINASMTLQGISDSQVEMHLTDTDYIDTRVNFEVSFEAMHFAVMCVPAENFAEDLGPYMMRSSSQFTFTWEDYGYGPEINGIPLSVGHAGGLDDMQDCTEWYFPETRWIPLGSVAGDDYLRIVAQDAPAKTYKEGTLQYGVVHFLDVYFTVKDVFSFLENTLGLTLPADSHIIQDALKAEWKFPVTIFETVFVLADTTKAKNIQVSVSDPAPKELVLKFEGENFTHGTRAVSISEADEEEGL